MANPVTGVVVLIRHGDRQGFYQSPSTYTASLTNLTVLGYLEELNSGAQLRSRYLNSSSSSLIQGVDTTLAENTQIEVLADAGGEGGVIVESANAFMQGLFPAFAENITLANGTTVSWDNRAQLIPVQTIEPEQSFVMEPWTMCDKFDDFTNGWYQSSDFKAKSAEAQPFYDSIPSSVIGNRNKTLVNAWNVFDYLNVEKIHDAVLAPQITDEMLSNALTWAEYHEAGLFGQASPESLGSIAGRGMLNPLTEAINRVANSSDPLKVSVLAASYKPFFSLFSLFQMPELQGKLVDYASAMVFEVRQDKSMQIFFRNGSYGDLAQYKILDSDSLPVQTFFDHYNPIKLETVADWCNACGETEARGCAALNALNGTGSGNKYADVTSTTGKHQVSPVTAGLIGAMVSLALAAVIAVALGFTIKKRSKSRYPGLQPLRGTGSASTVNHRDNSVELHSNADSHRKESWRA
ncbi:Histidine phosphatase superfamily, clade-2 [Kalmanozyma brasiliensis GHG001]|uniref:Histidine phosphatase superfamily, clade-2 n=1 Tax=Kalmanozyma brasiliensis (strain GHG001) TaxID=1365824 RepID=UPI002867F8F5|nr:Histidine phosphatase superfamily, clade-2 [Kalmanozyma brasiliensis GHG001]KAF6767142.1 Histidine phosphatase superfamily, clade-2 [Kalmanozyma brasiliensis GHG001]